MSDMISRKAAIELRQHIANMIGALPNSSIDAALREYANTLRALPSVGVKVKQLEWVSMTITKEHKGLSGIWLHAWGVNGQYEVHVFDTDPGHVMLNGPDIVPTDIYDTIEAAKAAAQSDYEARIMAALDVQPAPAPSPDVAALVAAATGIMRHMPDHPDTSWQDLAEALAAFAQKGGDA